MVANLQDGPQWSSPVGIHVLVKLPPKMHQDQQNMAEVRMYYFQS